MQFTAQTDSMAKIMFWLNMLIYVSILIETWKYILFGCYMCGIVHCTHTDMNVPMPIYFCIQVYKHMEIDSQKHTDRCMSTHSKSTLHFQVVYSVLVLCYVSEVLLKNYVASPHLFSTF